MSHPPHLSDTNTNQTVVILILIRARKPTDTGVADISTWHVYQNLLFRYTR